MRELSSKNTEKLLMTAVFIQMVLLFLSAAITKAGSPEQKGLEIVQESEKRDTGFTDITANMLMVLKNKNGDESIRNIRLKVLEVDADGDKTLTIFDNPKDVKGTAFLTFSHKIDDDDQWLYLPALKRIKRISSSNKSGSFMGSEFSYEDIASSEVEKYTYKWIRDEVLNGQDCFVVEYYPVDKRDSGYSRQIKWIDKSKYRVWKIEYYDRKNAHLKTLLISGYDEYLDKYWRAAEYNMVNHQNRKSTRLTFSDFHFSVGLNESDFTKNALKRVK